MIPTEIVQALIIALGNFGGILVAYYLLDRRIEGKVLKYWQKIKASEEGQDLFTILKETKTFIKSGEAQKLFKEAEELMNEFRALLKMIKERTAPQEEDDEKDSPVLPRLVSKEKAK